MLDWILLPSVTGSTRLGVGGRYLFWASLFYLPVISRDGGDLSTRKELDSLLTNRWAPDAPDAPDAPNAPSFTPSLLPLGLDGLPPPLLASHLVRHSTACDVRIDANKWHWQSKKNEKQRNRVVMLLIQQQVLSVSKQKWIPVYHIAKSRRHLAWCRVWFCRFFKTKQDKTILAADSFHRKSQPVDSKSLIFFPTYLIVFLFFHPKSKLIQGSANHRTHQSIWVLTKN